MTQEFTIRILADVGEADISEIMEKALKMYLERRCEVFSERELKGLDRGYFNIIMANDYDLTLMSKNTGHYWYLQ